MTTLLAAKRRVTRTTPGAYLTNGEVLVEVCEHLEDKDLLVVEDVRVPLDTIIRYTIPMTRVRRDWRLVTPKRIR